MSDLSPARPPDLTHTPSRYSRFGDVVALLAVITLPLLGAAWGERDLARLRAFPPPLEIPTEYVRYHPLAAALVAVAFGALMLAWSSGRRRIGTPFVTTAPHESPAKPHRFPVWGWAAAVWTLLWWLVAWSRLPAFAAVQRYTFFPLWLGFVLTANAWAQQRSGRCLMLAAPRVWFPLFIVSAVFWWLFEWLNRFVLNWHYLGVQDFGPVAYAVHASLCFSTVLPALAAAAEVLQTFPRWRALLVAGPSWRWLADPRAAVGLICGGAVALLLTGLYPTFAYPALWSAPLALLLGARVVTRSSPTIQRLARGDWTQAGSWMVAALICGGFWEMWNWRSFARWIYTVPGVERWYLFEMPLLGYTGYLPFGLLALLVAEGLLRSSRHRLAV